jgi:hypothetical protein
MLMENLDNTRGHNFYLLQYIFNLVKETFDKVKVNGMLLQTLFFEVWFF